MHKSNRTGYFAFRGLSFSLLVAENHMLLHRCANFVAKALAASQALANAFPAGPSAFASPTGVFVPGPVGRIFSM